MVPCSPIRRCTYALDAVDEDWQRMRLTEFWRRMESALGPVYARSWAKVHVVAELDHRTVDQALADGEDAKVVWRAVWANLDLPVAER